jgi:bacteriorhodopsin
MQQPQNPIPATKLAENEKPISTKFDIVKMTFYITYVLLITTGTITIIEALATTNPMIRHIMNLETCISLIAGYFYSQFVSKVTTANGVIDYKDINETRYNDWFITTPLMILVVMLSLGYNNRQKVHLTTYLTAAILNFAMLYSGYLGEKGKISKITGCLVGFIFFIGLFGLIYFNFVRGSKAAFNFILFGIYLFIWSIYGFVYLLDEENKNIIYNILDVTAKCFVGLGLWAYFTKIIVA